MVVLALTAFVFRRTLFGISVRAASEDFDAARLMGVRANRVIAGAFAFAGLLAGVAAVLILMRSPSAEPTLGGDYLVKAVVAAIIGGLGSFSGAVVGGLALGLAEVLLRSYLPDGAVGPPDRRRRLRARRRAVHRPPAGPVHRAHRGARVMDAPAARLRSHGRRARVLFAVLVVGADALHGDGRRRRATLLVQELLVNLVLVLGLQVFIGSTGDPLVRPPRLRPDRRLRRGARRRSPSRPRRPALPDLPVRPRRRARSARSPPRSSASSSPSPSAPSSASPSPAPAGWRRR